MHMKKTAIVTGGSRGIGFSIAKQLGEDGYNVVIMAKSAAETCRENLEILSSLGIPYTYVQGDVSLAEDREKCVETILQNYGGVHELVNNAGVAPKVRTDILEMTGESFDYVIGINLKGPLLFTQTVAKEMMKNSEDAHGLKGIIVNIGSISAELTSVNRGEYCISKAGMGMMTTLFADRLAGENIRVYEVRPGITKTDMTAGVQSKYDALIDGGLCPIARWGLPEDIANAVSLFCSGRLSYSTGEVLHVDGGLHIKKL
jgi:3-oxoacyl-[acyl-carrier protein] reductase